LTSDTRTPIRLSALPPVGFQWLLGVDAILHIGDVDGRAVLDRPHQIALVQGNWHLLGSGPMTGRAFGRSPELTFTSLAANQAR
jgi:hypothetical protein